MLVQQCHCHYQQFLHWDRHLRPWKSQPEQLPADLACSKMAVNGSPMSEVS